MSSTNGMFDRKVSMISCCKSDSVLCLVTAEMMVVVAITAVARLLLAVVGASLQGLHDIEPCSWPTQG